MSVIRLGLERIAKLLVLLDNPQEKIRIIHCGGTNGKGSVCAFITSVLSEASFNVGRFTSPHLLEPRDCIWVGGNTIGIQEYQKVQKEVRDVIGTRDWTEEGGIPTPFEMLTACAFLHFFQTQVDFAVIEVGLGGRLDATNTASSTLVTVITSIGDDHKEYLGDTIQRIATEKAGIIKQGGTVVVAHQKEWDAMQVFQQYANKMGAELIIAPPSIAHPQKEHWAIFQHTLEYHLPMLGDFQLENSAAAIAVLQVLQKKFNIDISENAIVKGIANTKWEGRLQWKTHPKFGNDKFLIDGAHNKPAAKELRKFVDNLQNKESISHVIWIFTWSTKVRTAA